MRHASRGKFVATYDPRAKEKADIREKLNRCKTALHGFNFPRVSFIFYMPIPASIRKRDAALYNSETLKHDKKPDVDNLIKLYLDCMDGIVIQGDQKVSLGASIKLYSPHPRTAIWVHETDSVITPQELDCTFLGSEELDIPTFCESAFPHGLKILGRTVHLQSLGNLVAACQVQSSVAQLQVPYHQG